ncbi:MAG: PorT family protein [Spirochaetota bacterium]|nr:PorT family protein [Spirochaetota bacterium]
MVKAIKGFTGGKGILLAIMMLSLTQTEKVQGLEFKITPKAGLGLSRYSGVDYVRSQMGVIAGLAVGAEFTDRWSLELSGFYLRKGGREIFKDSILEYVAIPLTLRFRIVDRVSVLIGPQIGFLMNAVSNEQSVREFTEALDFSLVFGFSYYFPINNDRLVFEFLIDAGMTDFSKEIHPYITGDNRNRAAYVTVGWCFSL